MLSPMQSIAGCTALTHQQMAFEAPPDKSAVIDSRLFQRLPDEVLHLYTDLLVAVRESLGHCVEALQYKLVSIPAGLFIISISPWVTH